MGLFYAYHCSFCACGSTTVLVRPLAAVRNKVYMVKKIIMTCGPACQDDSLLRHMTGIASGFRLNIAHLDSEKLNWWLARLLQLRVETGKPFSIILDLQGAKVRIGEYPAATSLPAEVELFHGRSSTVSGCIPVPASSVFLQTLVGDRLFLNDRKVIIKIIEKQEDRLGAVVEQNGPLSSGKGLNSPDRVFEMARVTEGDQQAIDSSRHIDGIAYAVSFVADGRESDLYRPLVGGAPLIAKIEQRAAFSHLAAIDSCFDEFWLCRGDLGAEAGFKELGKLQNNFIAALAGLTKPAIIAGEVLGSMVAFPQPSRAEIVQLHDAMQDGFAGLVLSDETACGKQIPAVIDFLRHFFS